MKHLNKFLVFLFISAILILLSFQTSKNSSLDQKRNAIVPNVVLDQRYFQGITKIQFARKHSGTCFLIDIDSVNYVVSAKHIFPGVKNDTEVRFSIMHDSKWKEIRAKAYIHDNPDIDIVVFPIHNRIVKGNPFDLEQPLFMLTMTSYFLGYPYGFETPDIGKVNIGYPVPLVKKAIYSGSASTPSGISISLFDGHNNPGFSGGPIYIFDPKKNKYQLAGVISAYVNQSNELVTPLGKLKYAENSGIIIVHNASHIYNLISEIK